MASKNDWPETRFLFPDMFSFSFEPEVSALKLSVLTFLWGLCTNKGGEEGVGYRNVFPKSFLLDLLVPYASEDPGFITFLRYSAVTSGVILVVSFTSYSTFWTLQKIRYEGIAGLKVALSKCSQPFKHLFTSKKDCVPSSVQVKHDHNLVLPAHGKLEGTLEICKRPSKLQLVLKPNCNLSEAHYNKYNNVQPLNDEGSAEKLGGAVNISSDIPPALLVSPTPESTEFASGDEDAEDIQIQYFGPTGGRPLDRDNPRSLHHPSLMDSSPASPESALSLRYEPLPRSVNREK